MDSSGFDLRKYQKEGAEQDKIKGIMGKILSGRDGYEVVEEKKEEIIRCKNCEQILEGHEKFCPECGSGCKD